MNKTDISKQFAHLRNFGFRVINFNTQRSHTTRGMKDFVDYVLISKKYMVFVEVKIGKDKLNEEQQKTGEIISHLSTANKAIHYRLIKTLEETKTLTNLLLEKKL